MKSEPVLRYQLSLHEAATRRLTDVESLQIGTRSVPVALPASYAKKTRQRYPLLLVLDSGDQLGSVIEMSRLMTQTSEVQASIVVGVAVTASELIDAAEVARRVDEVIAACDARYRSEPGAAIVFGHAAAGHCLLQWLAASLASVRRFIVADPDALPAMSQASVASRQLVLCASANGIDGKSLDVVAAEMSTACAGLSVSAHTLDDADLLVGSLAHGLRQLTATGRQYGDEILAMRKPLMMRTMRLLSPLLGRLTAKPPLAVVDDTRYRLHSTKLSRDFEIFVSMPRSVLLDSTRRYPALVVLDANIEFSIAAETAARMAARGQIEELIVIGIGVPRAEGAVAFGFRRFEELSPPADGYDYGDDLGRIFRSLFSMRGQDARQRLGRAPDLLAFIVNEMLPQLSMLPIATERMGLLGHSAGGTFAAYALSQATSPFKHYFAISPGIGISGSWLMKQPRSAAVAGRSAVLSLGSEELANGFNNIAGIPDTEAYSQRLREPGNMDVAFRCFDGETHSTIFPRALVHALATRYAAGASR
jgi:predicted alpha/beta superfamily hydrolase